MPNFSDTETRKGFRFEDLVALYEMLIHWREDKQVKFARRYQVMNPFDDLYLLTGSGIHKHYQMKHSGAQLLTWSVLLNQSTGLLPKAHSRWHSGEYAASRLFCICTDRYPSSAAPQRNGPYSQLPKLADVHERLSEVSQLGDLIPQWDTFAPHVAIQMYLPPKSLNTLVRELMTTQFFGDVDEAKLGQLMDVMQEEAYETPTLISDFWENVGLHSRRRSNIHAFDFSETARRRQSSDDLQALIQSPTFTRGYIVVAGPPGIGKSTFLASEEAGLPRVASYRCYTNIKQSQPDRYPRWLGVEFLREILSQINSRSGSRFTPSGDYEKLVDAFHEALEHLSAQYRATGKKSVILIDGLDQSVRDQWPPAREAHLIEVLNRFPASNIPPGVVLVVGTQLIGELPGFLNRQDATIQRIGLPPLRVVEIESYLRRRPIGVELARYRPLDKWAEEILRKTDGIPLLVEYVTQWLEDRAVPGPDLAKLLSTLPRPDAGSPVYHYYDLLWQSAMKHGAQVQELAAVILALNSSFTPIMLADILGDTTTAELFKAVFSHLCRTNGETYWIFHASFGEFIRSKTLNILPEAYRKVACYFARSGRPVAELECLWESGDKDNLRLICRKWTWERLIERRTQMAPSSEVKREIHYGLLAAARTVDIPAFVRLALIASEQNRINAHPDEVQFEFLLEGVIAAGLSADGLMQVLEEPLEQSYYLYLDLVPTCIKIGALGQAREIDHRAERPEFDVLDNNPELWEDTLYVETLLWAIDPNAASSGLQYWHDVVSRENQFDSDTTFASALMRAHAELWCAGLCEEAHRLERAAPLQFATMLTIVKAVRLGIDPPVVMTERQSSLFPVDPLMIYQQWAVGNDVTEQLQFLPSAYVSGQAQPANLAVLEAVQELRGWAGMSGLAVPEGESDDINRRLQACYRVGALLGHHTADALLYNTLVVLANNQMHDLAEYVCRVLVRSRRILPGALCQILDEFLTPSPSVYSALPLIVRLVHWLSQIAPGDAMHLALRVDQLAQQSPQNVPIAIACWGYVGNAARVRTLLERVLSRVDTDEWDDASTQFSTVVHFANWAEPDQAELRVNEYLRLTGGPLAAIHMQLRPSIRRTALAWREDDDAETAAARDTLEASVRGSYEDPYEFTFMVSEALDLILELAATRAVAVDVWREIKAFLERV